MAVGLLRGLQKQTFKALQVWTLAQVADGEESPKAAPFQPCGTWALQHQIRNVKGLQVCKQKVWNWQRTKSIFSLHFTVCQAVLPPSLWASARCLPVAPTSWQLHLADDLSETCWSWPATGGWAWTRGPRVRYWRRQSWALRRPLSCQLLCCG